MLHNKFMQKPVVNQSLVAGNLFFALFSSVNVEASVGVEAVLAGEGPTLIVLILFFIGFIAVGGGGWLIEELRDRFMPGKPPVISAFDRNFTDLTRNTLPFLKEGISEMETISVWGQFIDPIFERTKFLRQFVEPLGSLSDESFQQAIKKADLILITRYYDLIDHSSGGNARKREDADEREISKLVKQLPDSEKKSLTLEKIIRMYYSKMEIKPFLSKQDYVGAISVRDAENVWKNIRLDYELSFFP